MSIRLLVLLLVGALIVLGGCADANRVVTSREITTTPTGAPVFRIGWLGDVYGEQLFDYPRPNPVFEQECYEQVVVGEVLPFECLSVNVLHRETDAFARSEWLALSSSFLVMGALVLFSMRRISWSPQVAATTEHQSSESAMGTADSAVELMRSIESEKGSRVESLAAGHDIPRPLVAGIGMGALILVVITLLVGYGTSLSWGIVTAMLMFLSVGGTAAAVMLGGFGRRSNMDPLMRRLLFLSGVVVGTIVLSLGGFGSRLLLYRLNGVDWPF